jgi:hypothetical protein
VGETVCFQVRRRGGQGASQMRFSGRAVGPEIERQGAVIRPGLT